MNTASYEQGLNEKIKDEFPIYFYSKEVLRWPNANREFYQLKHTVETLMQLKAFIRSESLMEFCKKLDTPKPMTIKVDGQGVYHLYAKTTKISYFK